MGRFSAYILAALVLFQATWASSAPQPPRKVEKIEMVVLDRVYLRFSDTSRVLMQLVSCRLAKDENGARAVFDFPLRSSAQFEALHEFIGVGETTGCLSVISKRLSTTDVMALGALADTLIDLDRVGLPLGQPPGETREGGGEYLWTWQRIATEQEDDQYLVGACLVARYPSRVAEVLATGQTSNDERKLFNSMRIEIESCTPTGKKLILHPMYLRAALAASYYSASRLGGGD